MDRIRLITDLKHMLRLIGMLGAASGLERLALESFATGILRQVESSPQR